MDAKKKTAEKTPKETRVTMDTRKTVRRKNTDRRTEVRFEPDKENRRQNKGRRSSDEDIWGS
jgi:hypothetical protein